MAQGPTPEARIAISSWWRFKFPRVYKVAIRHAKGATCTKTRGIIVA
jgi:hypothetical protein